MGERIAAELLAQPHHGRTQPLHRGTTAAELGQQPGFDELAPRHRFVAGALHPDHRRVVDIAAVVPVDPTARGACGQREQPVYVGEGVDTAIQQRDHHRLILARDHDARGRVRSSRRLPLRDDEDDHHQEPVRLGIAVAGSDRLELPVSLGGEPGDPGLP